MPKSTNKWFRFYVDWLDNPKVQMLDATLQQRYIMLLCLRSMGEIPGMDAKAIAWRLRIDLSDFENSLKILKEKGLWTGKDIPNWNKRQYVSDCSTERSRKHRATSKQRCSNGDATLQQRPQNQTQNTDTDTEKNPPTPRKRGAPSAPDPGRSPDPDVAAVVAHLNAVTGKAHSLDRGNQQIIGAIKRGATVDDCKAVIDHCWRQWSADPKMVRYVDKSTPFRAANFDRYLDESRAGAPKPTAPASRIPPKFNPEDDPDMTPEERDASRDALARLKGIGVWPS